MIIPIENIKMMTIIKELTVWINSIIEKPYPDSGDDVIELAQAIIDITKDFNKIN